MLIACVARSRKPGIKEHVMVTMIVTTPEVRLRNVDVNLLPCYHHTITRTLCKYILLFTPTQTLEIC